MLANVVLEGFDLSVQIRPLEGGTAEAFQQQLADQAEPLGFQLALQRVPDAEGVRLAGRAFAHAVIEGASVTWPPEVWGEWFAKNPEVFYQLLAVAEHPDRWREWSEDDGT